MDKVAKSARAQADSFGIHIVDVRIKRADLPPAVQESVFKRMVAERQRESSRYRAEGEERGQRIRAEADRERAVTLADAREQAQRTRGEGDAQAIAIYAEALKQDPEFYSFTRRLEAYRKLLGKDDVCARHHDEFFSLPDQKGNKSIPRPRFSIAHASEKRPLSRCGSITSSPWNSRPCATHHRFVAFTLLEIGRSRRRPHQVSSSVSPAQELLFPLERLRGGTLPVCCFEQTLIPRELEPRGFIGQVNTLLSDPTPSP